jgi:hypothetical protein
MENWKPKFEPWADWHTPQNFHRCDPTGRYEPLYTGERDWRMIPWRDYLLYVAALIMLLVVATLWLG